jgi:membrane associated rhomboid family serine protease
MIPAPVGFQCPECVAGAAAQTRQPTTVAGARMIQRPVITYALIGLDVVLYVMQFFAPKDASNGYDIITLNFGMWPIGIAVDNEWWRLASAAFLHGGWMHLAFNMYVLYALGPTLERIMGHSRYLILYVLAALGGGVASYVFSPMNTVSVGASGAIFGLMGALVVAGRRLKYDITQVLFLLGINVVIGFLSPGVDWRAHLGGLVTGALVAALFVMPKPRYRLPIQVVGILALVVVLAAMTMWRTTQILDAVGLANSLFT